MSRAGISAWDILIVGDGSGQGWNSACGWASILIDKQYRQRRVFYGAMNPGSVNSAESMPYGQALQWYDNTVGKALLRQVGTLRVHILTDSQYIAVCGSHAMSAGFEIPRKHLLIWAALREYRRLGYLCQFHWARRMTSELNWAADIIAGLAREGMEELKTTDDVLARRAAYAIDNLRFEDFSGVPISIYDLNPDSP